MICSNEIFDNLIILNRTLALANFNQQIVNSNPGFTFFTNENSIDSNRFLILRVKP